MNNDSKSLTIGQVNVSPNQAVINSVKDMMGPEYHFEDCGDYIVIVHAQQGAAALVPGGTRLSAETAAREITDLFKGNGLNLQAIPLATTDTKVEPPTIIRSGTFTATDVAVSMARHFVNQKELTLEEFEKARSLLKRHVAAIKKRVLDPAIMTMIKATVARVTEGKPILAGPEVTVDEVVMPEFLLPAILLAAAENWTLPVHAKGGKGGFVVHMKADDTAVLMFRVTHIEVSSPLLLMLPLVDVIRRSKRGGEFVLDQCIERFGNFITAHLTPEMQTSLEVRIATSG